MVRSRLLFRRRPWAIMCREQRFDPVCRYPPSIRVKAASENKVWVRVASIPHLNLKIFWVTLALYLLMVFGRPIYGICLRPFANEAMRVSLAGDVLWRGVLNQMGSVKHVTAVIASVPLAMIFPISKVLNGLVHSTIVFLTCSLGIFVVRVVVFSLFAQKFATPDLNDFLFALYTPALALVATHFVDRFHTEEKFI